MLSVRLFIGIPIVLGVLALSFLDMYLSDRLVSFWIVNRIPRGIILFPLFILVVAILCNEVLDLLEAARIKPRRSTVYLCNTGLVLICWLACIWQQWKLDQVPTENLISPTGWDWAATASIVTLVAIALCVVVAFVGEIIHFKSPGNHAINLSGAVFTVVYIGLLATFLVQLRVAFGIAALFSLIIVAKMGDIGAFLVGRMIGRTKLSPGLSPGKTIEGLIGGLAFGCFGSWVWFKIVIPITAGNTWLIDGDVIHKTPMIGWIAFGFFVSGAGVLGDLSESLLKREAMRKDSSRWLPGFGGVLDIFDSLLIAAPVAYACWVFRWVCPGYH
ncbi:MAG TPA: hypothetical protein DEB39_00280 [Planctomycetaceae bacterium]|nr:hypothetical protein [Planctomycetaceae bacterium]